ncbi:ABC transporter permease [Cryptosporangium arvum]|uniref:ABC-type multidrug transport system, permease component n=1 Tax=Cryptosporangium arvum DSM 44712 TaxID=927661 RepID=A0A010ZZ38_9ACTN|nr:ABC transporter permease [Cryptosporangium arvum]EXG82482.1 ABC-type multidrug transport system, permease component [Cryptosporangium arvum DSM 44712]
MKALVIAGTNLRRMFRDRTTIFFVGVFPLLLILVLGLAYGGASEPRVGVSVAGSGPLAEELERRLRGADGLDVRTGDSADAVVRAVERGQLEAGVLVPAGYDRDVAAGRTVTVRVIVPPGLAGQQTQASLRAVVGLESDRLRAAQALDVPLSEAVVRVDEAQRSVPGVPVRTRTEGDAAFGTSTGRFDVGASSQLVLFVFVTSMNGAAALIETRRLGVSRRMLTTATSAGTIVTGEALGRFAVAAAQGAIIMAGSALLFGVRWGDPVASVLLMLVFALFAAGAGMLLGTLARSVQQATAVGLLAGLGLAALGGAMMPLEFFSPVMRLVAHGTPHGWAVEGFGTLLRHGGTLVDVLPQLGVLAGGAAGVFTLAAWRFRAILTR